MSESADSDKDGAVMTCWPEQPLAVVVGAGGMGMAIARRLGQCHRLLLVDIDREKVAGHTAALRQDGIDAAGIACDITLANDVRRLAAQARSMGGFRALAQVAGLSPSMAGWRDILAVNLVGVTLVTRELLPLAGPGCAAVLISSLSAHLAEPDPHTRALLDDPLAPDLTERLEAHLGAGLTAATAYMLSKYQINRMAEKLAVAWGKKGARIMSLSPGLIATPMGRREFENNPGKARLLEQTPLRRQGGMQEIADAVEFLLSSKASFISGSNLLVDGGVAAALKHNGVGRAPEP